MNLINPNNIDKWLFDYFEGNLSLHEKIEVETFLKNNPEFQADFEAWESSFIPQHDVVYHNAHSLVKKSPVTKRAVALFLFIAIVGGGLLTYLNYTNQLQPQRKYTASNNAQISLDRKSDKIPFSTPLNNGDIEKSVRNDLNEEYALDYSSSNQLLTFAKGNNTLANNKFILERRNTNGVGNEKPILSSSPPQLGNLKEDVLDVTDQVQIEDDKLEDNHLESTLSSNLQEVSRNSIEANGVSLSIIRNVRKGPRMVFYAPTEVSKNYLLQSSVKKHKNYVNIKAVEVQNTSSGDTREYNSYKSSRNQTMAKNLARMFNKDLALTVYNNRIMMKDNLMSLQANQSLSGGYKSPRVQLGYMQNTEANTPFSAYASTDFKIRKQGLGFFANYWNDNGTQNYNTSLIYSYGLELGIFKIRPSVAGKYAKEDVLASETSGGTGVVTSDNFLLDAGIMIETPFLYVGAQSKNMGLISYNKSLSTSELFNGNRGYSVVIGTDYRQTFQQNIVVSPQLYIDFMEHNRPTQFTFATTANFNGLLAGGSYSSQQEIGAMLGAQIKNFRLMYRASANKDMIASSSFNEVLHELGVQFMITKKTRGYLLYD